MPEVITSGWTIREIVHSRGHCAPVETRILKKCVTSQMIGKQFRQWKRRLAATSFATTVVVRDGWCHQPLRPCGVYRVLILSQSECKEDCEDLVLRPMQILRKVRTNHGQLCQQEQSESVDKSIVCLTHNTVSK